MEETLRMLEAAAGPGELATGRPCREAARELREAMELMERMREEERRVQSSRSMG